MHSLDALLTILCVRLGTKLLNLVQKPKMLPSGLCVSIWEIPDAPLTTVCVCMGLKILNYMCAFDK